MSENDFCELKQDVSLIKEALLGNALNGKLGVLHHHNQMYADLYGMQPDGKTTKESIENSMLSRMSKVEDNQKKIIWMGAGAGAGAATAWAAILRFIGR